MSLWTFLTAAAGTRASELYSFICWPMSPTIPAIAGTTFCYRDLWIIDWCAHHRRIDGAVKVVERDELDGDGRVRSVCGLGRSACDESSDDQGMQ